jgi:hypothetical protein
MAAVTPEAPENERALNGHARRGSDESAQVTAQVNGALTRVDQAPTSVASEVRLDEREIGRTLALLFEPSQVFEVRVLKAVPKRGWQKARTFIGYFRGAEGVELARELRAFRAWSGAYITLNPINEDLYARCATRLQDSIPATQDSDVVARRLLFIDFDPIRPSGISSSSVSSVRSSRPASLSMSASSDSSCLVIRSTAGR